MKNLAFVILIIAFHALAWSQSIAEYRPLKFDGFEPIWTHAVYDSTIIGHYIDHPNMTFGFDGYSHVWSSLQNNIFEPIIHKGYLYNINKTIYRNDLSGALIEKINLSTGEAQWRASFDGRDSIRETVEKVVLKNDTLLFYTIRVTTPEPEFPLVPALAWGLGDDGGVLTVRKYNAETGELLDYKTADHLDPNVKFLKPYAGNINVLQPIGDEMLLSLSNHFNPVTKGYYLVFDTLNLQGEYLGISDTLYSEFNVNWQLVRNTRGFKYLYDTYENSVYWVDYYNLHDDADNFVATQVNLKRISSNGVQTFALDFLEPNEMYYFGLMTLNENFILLYVNDINQSNGKCLLLDKNGSLIRSIDVGDKVDIDEYIELDSQGNFICANNTGTAGDYGYQILATVTDQIVGVKQFACSESYYPAYHHKTVKLDNGDFLLYIIQFDGRPESTQPGRFFSIMRVTPEMIGLTSNADETAINGQGYISVFPNPTSSFVQFDTDILKIDKIKILDAVGREILTVTNPNTSQMIDVSSLQSGIYHMKFLLEGDQVFTVKQFIKF